MVPSASPHRPPPAEDTAWMATRYGRGSKVGKISPVISEIAVRVSCSTPIRLISDTTATAPGNSESTR